MRGPRWLVLVAIAAILGGVGLTYRAQKKVLREQAPPQPAALPTNLNSSAKHWHFTDTDLKTGRVIADIDAEGFRQVKEIKIGALTAADHSSLRGHALLPILETVPKGDGPTTGGCGTGCRSHALPAGQAQRTPLTSIANFDAEFRTGGIEKSFARIAEEVRSRYTLGYYSHEPFIDGKYRTLEVRVIGHGNNLSILTKKGYYPSAMEFRPRPAAAH